MKLYHGTTGEVARRVLTEGLLTREQTGSEGHWQHTVDSAVTTVHLTTVYAPYFGLAASGTDEVGIVEVDIDALDPDEMMPDEDFLEQVTRGGQNIPRDDELFDSLRECGDDMIARTEWFRDRLHAFRHLWEKSVETLGTCCHSGEIPPEAITRVSLFKPETNPLIHMMAGDPIIMPLNYMLCRDRYAALTKWFFEPLDDDGLGAAIGMTGFEGMSDVGEFAEFNAKRMRTSRDAFGNRDGLEVVERE
jgi:hypothetical protein